jgi:hypothetical protein
MHTIHQDDRGGSGLSMERWLSRGTFFFLAVFVAAAPDSIAVAQIAYSGALLCWLLRWVAGRLTPRPQPLVFPLLVFLLLSTLSAALSFAPTLSWGHLKSVALLLICVLWAQNIKSFPQLKFFSTLLIVACLVTVAYTAWQYTIGIGVRLSQASPETALARAGLQEEDYISSVNGHLVRDPASLAAAIEKFPSAARVRMTILRGEPLQRLQVAINRADLAGLERDMNDGKVRLTRGRPTRAQGFYSHFVTYADVLIQIALLAWGLFVACPQRRMRLKIVLGFIALAMACALWLTLTRAAMASFLAGCLLVIFIAFPWRVRLGVMGLVVVAVLIGGFLLRERRGVAWMDLKSPEAQYRFLMWKDGLRLIHERPLFGVGMDSLEVRGKQWNIEAYKVFPLRSHFHSTPVQIAVERGLLTLLAWLWLLVGYFRVLLRLLKVAGKGDWYARGLALGLLSAACGFLLGSLVDYSWGDSEVIMIFWMFAGWALALDHLLSASSDLSEATVGQ